MRISGIQTLASPRSSRGVRHILRRASRRDPCERSAASQDRFDGFTPRQCGVDVFRLGPLPIMVRPMAMKAPAMRHERMAVLPVVAIVAAPGIWITRSQVLAICVGIELCTGAGVGDNRLRRQRRCGECHRDKNGGPDQCGSHLSSPQRLREQDDNPQRLRQRVFGWLFRT